ncbi:MAG: amino acid ABC transporter substrate-binding protein [Desulfobacter sp.]|nr:MAG: amino acid ABC transporter substrate-binding protein [Desulfobacter sp.]
MVEDPWPPYTIGEYGEPSGGIAVDLTREIFRRIGLVPRLELYPWQRVLKMAETGKVDGIMLLMRTKEREAFLVYTDKLFTNMDRVFSNRKSHSTPVRTLEDLSDFRLGYVLGYVYGDKVDNLLAKLAEKAFAAYTSEENLRYLVDGRVDFIIESRNVVQGILSLHPEWAGRIHEMDIEMETYDYYMGISRKSKYASRIKDLNSAIAQMKSDGTMDRLAGGAGNR